MKTLVTWKTAEALVSHGLYSLLECLWNGLWRLHNHVSWVSLLRSLLTMLVSVASRGFLVRSVYSKQKLRCM